MEFTDIVSNRYATMNELNPIQCLYLKASSAKTCWWFLLKFQRKSSKFYPYQE
jgi:hypothetical protein